MPFIIKDLKIYVYSPNLAYNVKLSKNQKDYDVLTIDEFQNKCQFHLKSNQDSMTSTSRGGMI